MKRMKGVAAPFESSPSSYGTVFEDPRIRLRHQSLMQDYEDLYKETEAEKNKLEMMKQKKLTLLAEVRFLRQRYKYLMQNQSQRPSPGPKYVQLQRPNLVDGSRTVRKEKNYSGNKAAVPMQPRATGIDLNRRKKGYSERETTLQTPVSNFDLSQKKKSYSGKEAALHNSGAILDLNQTERIYNGKEAGVRNNTPTFDLNEISREEEELQPNGQGMRIEEPKIFSVRGGNDEHSDMKLSACRSVGNGSSRAGKRKISWQDQVALRV